MALTCAKVGLSSTVEGRPPDDGFRTGFVLAWPKRQAEIQTFATDGGTPLKAHPDWKLLAEISPLLGALPAEARDASRILAAAPTTRLFQQGDEPAFMHFVIAGDIRLVRRSRAGTEITLQRTRGGFLAEASLDQSAYHCDAVAAATSEILAISLKPFRQALSVETFRDGWVAHLARELRRARSQSERLILRSTRERIVHYIEAEGRDGRITLTQSKKGWAAELGISHEALYRTLASMVRREELVIEGAMIALAV